MKRNKKRGGKKKGEKKRKKEKRGEKRKEKKSNKIIICIVAPSVTGAREWGEEGLLPSDNPIICSTRWI